MAKAPSSRFQHVVDDILANAARLFDEQGYGRVSLQDIADAVGIARPSLYHYFGSKEDILAALVDRSTATREQTIETVRGMDGNPISRLKTLLRLAGESTSSNAAGLRLTLDTSGALPPDVSRRSIRSRRLLFELLVEILAEGMDSGVVRPMNEHEVAATMIAALSGLQYHDIGGVTMDPQHAAGLLEDFLVLGVSQPPDRQASNLDEALELLHQDLQMVERHARHSPAEGTR